MWIITKHGFVSIVREQRAGIPTGQLRLRAHAAAAFGPNPPGVLTFFKPHESDYEVHCVAEEARAERWLMDEVHAIDYATNVKGTVAQNDPRMGRPMMNLWNDLYDAYAPPAPRKPTWWEDLEAARDMVMDLGVTRDGRWT